VKPYLEFKVVKVEKKKKLNWVGGLDIEGKSYKVIRDKKGNYYLKDFEKPKKGNWVNGENIDKIKFPCFCSYQYFGKTRYAILSRGAEVLESPTKYPYSLIDINEQGYISESFEEYDLKEMILNHDIHILKGKIIIWEEE